MEYSVSGASLGSPRDEPGFTFYRSIEGTLTGDTLTVSGVATADSGWGATIDVEVNVEGQEPGRFHQEKFPKNGLTAEDPMRQPFSVTVPVPPDAKAASFRISLEGSYNAGSRGVVVEGNLGLPAGTGPSEPVEEEQKPKPPAEIDTCCEGCEHVGEDSGARFSGLSGEVSIRPHNNERAWRGAGLKSIINWCDHIRTGEESIAIISFNDMTTFTMKPETEIIVDPPQERQSKLSLVTGKIWMNLKKMWKDGTMEVQMSQAVAGIKGTTIVCEETGSSSVLKVLEGQASFRSRSTGEERLVDAGEMMIATTEGLSEPQPFDIESENESWKEYSPTEERPSSPEGWDLTGVWTCDDGGKYYIRQIGSTIWWYGESDPGSPIWSNVMHGTINGDTIDAEWADLPKGRVMGYGILTLHIDSSNRITASSKTGGFGGSVWTR
ncbi:FecR domain-containing protein [Methanothrix sp.]|uniref:FecR domain-containing protein n=1 Tax=Methanothrix sp. TaxID=90426 RepID=UPI003C75A270